MESASCTGPVHYRTAAVGGVNVFYREAGPDSGPVVLLLHGFPSSSRMFRDLIPRLSDAYHVIAPDYPAFGHSAVPDRSAFGYTFDHLADVADGLLGQVGIGTFAIYVMDFGAPVGFRLALRHPGRLSAIIVQNGPLYPEQPRGWWATRADAGLPGPGRATRMTARAAGAARRRAPGATAGSQSVLTGQRRLIDRSHCADPESVSLIGEPIIEGTHQRARPERMQGSSAPRSTSTTLEPTSRGCGGGTGLVGLARASFPDPVKRAESPSRLSRSTSSSILV